MRKDKLVIDQRRLSPLPQLPILRSIMEEKINLLLLTSKILKKSPKFIPSTKMNAEVGNLKCSYHGTKGFVCPKCKTNENFIKKALAIHGDGYDYSSIIPQSTLQKMTGL